MQPLFRYGLDLTGVNPDNFVGDEPHVLQERRNRPIVTKAGPYYADSLSVFDLDNHRQLNRGSDYVPIELDQVLSLLTGKDVFGAALVINRSVGKNIKISYQCVGGEHCNSAQVIFDLLEKIPDENLTFSWYEVDNKPNEFDPSPHFHPIGEPTGFEKLCHAVDRIYSAIVYTDLPAFKNLLDYTESIFDEINQRNILKMDSFFGPQFIAFKKQLNQSYYEIDKVSNLQIATEEDGRIAARPDSVVKNFTRTKYIALNSLVSFKNVLYNNFIRADTSGIGLSYTDNISPDAVSLFSMTTGSVKTIIPKNLIPDAIEDLNLSIYPTDIKTMHNFTIIRLSTNRNDMGGVWLLIESTGKFMYVVTHENGNEQTFFTHNRISSTEAIDVIRLKLADHLSTDSNKHNVNKSQVNLGLVENLPVITMDEVLCLDGKRKYITFDLFLLFTKIFFIGKQDSADQDRDARVNPLEELNIYKCVSEILQAERLDDCICETCVDTPTIPAPPPPPAPIPVDA